MYFTEIRNKNQQSYKYKIMLYVRGLQRRKKMKTNILKHYKEKGKELKCCFFYEI